jgi:parallel beta-helix repeat protein
VKFLFILAIATILSGSSSTRSASCSYYIDTAMYADSPNTFIDLNAGDIKLNDGGVLCIRSGVYQGLVIADIHFFKEKLTIQPAPNSNVIFKGRNYSGAGIRITKATGIRIQGFNISSGMYGIYTSGSSSLELLENTITDVGQEGIIVKAGKNGDGVSAITIANNIISDTGRRNGQYGEGIYIGDAGQSGQSIVADVHIYQNYLYRTKNEAIDIKSNTSNVNIIENTIKDTDLKFNGAITLAVGTYYGANSNFLVKSNKIIGVSNRSGYRPFGIAVGQGNATLINNLIVEKSSDFIGICLFSTFTNQTANLVHINENQIITSGEPIVERCADGGTGASNHGRIVY